MAALCKLLIKKRKKTDWT